MVTAIEPLLREQLINRRHRLEDAATDFQRPAELTRDGWEVSYHYEHAGAVSGDYCDSISSKGDTLFLYTDGLSESLDGTGNEYGPERLAQLLNENNHLSPDSIVSLCRRELLAFVEGRPPRDDLTLMAIRRTK